MPAVPRDKGFTLIEVLVALGIVAVAFAAIMGAMAQAIDTTATLRDRTFALWVAQNRLAEHQLKGDWPAAGTAQGESQMAGREWEWEEKITTSPLNDRLRQIEISVRAPGTDYVLARLTGLLRKPAATP